jgi:hypothetical protein
VIVSKSKLAARLNVRRAAVSAWIKRGHLTPPALREDGRIDYEVAVAQLADRLDVAKSRPRPPGGGYGQRIARARGDLLEVELDRQELHRQHRAGQLMPASDFERIIHRSATLAVESIGAALSDWAAMIRGAPSAEKALEMIEQRLAGIQEWVTGRE